GVSIEAMLDTGAKFTVLHSRFLSKIKHKFLGCPINVRVANGNVSKMSHIETTISIGSSSVRAIIGVLEPFVCDMILGLNAMSVFSLDVKGLMPFQVD